MKTLLLALLFLPIFSLHSQTSKSWTYLYQHKVDNQEFTVLVDTSSVSVGQNKMVLSNFKVILTYGTHLKEVITHSVFDCSDSTFVDIVAAEATDSLVVSQTDRRQQDPRSLLWNRADDVVRQKELNYLCNRMNEKNQRLS